MGSGSSLKTAVKEFYSKRAPRYDEVAGKLARDPRSREWLTDVFMLIASLEVPAHLPILDIGTGTAAVPLLLSRKYSRIVGLDLTGPMLLRASANLKAFSITTTDLVNADAESFPFGDSTFGGITCQRAFHHFANPDSVAAEIFRVLRKRGQVVIASVTLPENEEDAEFLEKLFRTLNPNYRNYMTIGGHEAIFGSAGLGGFKNRTTQKKMQIDLFLESWADPSVAGDKATEELREKALELLRTTNRDTRERLAVSSTSFCLQYSVMSWHRTK